MDSGKGLAWLAHALSVWGVLTLPAQLSCLCALEEWVRDADDEVYDDYPGWSIGDERD